MEKKLKYDFSGWATRNDLVCSDGRTIRRDAFAHCDGKTVPLVWNHQHDDPTNILGHALLENREDGVYAYCTFNETAAGKAAKLIVQHGDVDSLSIYANGLKQQGGNVMHGDIKELSLVVAVLRRACDIAVIAGDTGNSEEAGLLVHVVAHLVGSKTQLICNEGYSGGVYAAAACSHDNAVQRSEAHGSVNGLAALDGGDGGAVAEVAGYDLEILDILAHSVSESLAYKSVRCAVEAVLSYVQLLVALVGKAVHERLLRHGGMERGIEYDYLRSRSRNYLLACSQGERVGVVMYRCELCEVVYLLDNFVCNEGGLAEDLSALYYSVAYGGDLAHAVDDLALAGGEYLNELLERLGVGRELAVSLDCPAVERGVLDMAVDTDTVAVALCNNALVLHIDKLVLQRGAAGIDYKNLHVNKSFQVK